MTDISTYIQAIESAARGEEVRNSIVSALVAINESTHDSGLPSPTAEDAGKFLTVNSSGGWVLANIASAEEVSF